MHILSLKVFRRARRQKSQSRRWGEFGGSKLTYFTRFLSVSRTVLWVFIVTLPSDFLVQTMLTFWIRGSGNVLFIHRNNFKGFSERCFEAKTQTAAHINNLISFWGAPEF